MSHSALTEAAQSGNLLIVNDQAAWRSTLVEVGARTERPLVLVNPWNSVGGIRALNNRVRYEEKALLYSGLPEFREGRVIGEAYQDYKGETPDVPTRMLQQLAEETESEVTVLIEAADVGINQIPEFYAALEALLTNRQVQVIAEVQGATWGPRLKPPVPVTGFDTVAFVTTRRDSRTVVVDLPRHLDPNRFIDAAFASYRIPLARV